MNKRAQTILEFSFCMILTLILFYGLFMAWRWTGLDLAERRYNHEATLHDESLFPQDQLNSNFHRVRKIGSAVSMDKEPFYQ